jgi:hypothetical protein
MLISRNRVASKAKFHHEKIDNRIGGINRPTAMKNVTVEDLSRVDPTAVINPRSTLLPAYSQNAMSINE